MQQFYSILIRLTFALSLCSCASTRTTAPLKDPIYKDPTHRHYRIDTAIVATHLAEAIKIPTHSMTGIYAKATQPFLDFHQFLERSYPHIHTFAERHIINQYSVVYHFKGTNPTLEAGLFLAHQDVVPAHQPERWSVDPFGGVIIDEYVYGRGALDMKSTLIALMEAMEVLLANQFSPERDLYFCFGHDEELPTSEGAREIAHWMQQRGITPDYIIDEGGTVFDATPFGLEKQLALVGTSEKGYADITVSVTSDGGHSSLPTAPNAVARLAKIILEIETHPMKPLLTPALKQTLATAAPQLPRNYRWAATNAELLFPLIKNKLQKSPLTNALITTTTMPTFLSATPTTNSSPSMASATINTRIIQGYSCQDVHDYIQKKAGKGAIVSRANCSEPTPMSPVDSPYYRVLSKAITSVFGSSITLPYSFIANTDSRYYQSLCPNIYRFTPLQLTLDDQQRFHGINERCSISNLASATHFFINCIQLLSAAILP